MNIKKEKKEMNTNQTQVFGNSVLQTIQALNNSVFLYLQEYNAIGKQLELMRNDIAALRTEVQEIKEIKEMKDLNNENSSIS